METTYRIGIRIRFFVLLGLVFSIGCGTLSKPKLDRNSQVNQTISSSQQNTASTEMKGTNYGEQFGPPPPSPVPESTTTYGPEPVAIKSIVLVLGPGMAKGYAHIGILRGLAESKIPIAAIFGAEMGGLMGGLYAASSTLNQFEWGLLKFKSDIFQTESSFFSLPTRSHSNSHKLEAHLRQVFSNKDISKMRLPLRIAIQFEGSKETLLLDHGNISNALRATLAVPQWFSPVPWENSKFAMSPGKGTKSLLVSEARNLGLGPVIVVDVSSDSESAFSSDELQLADLVIRPRTSDIDSWDFNKMTEIAFRGKAAMSQIIPKIKKLIGMPESDSDSLPSSSSDRRISN